MSADDVLRLLDLLESSHVRVWIDGGWGIDALLHRQTRDHDDLDLVIDAGHLPTATELLRSLGFVVVRDWLPTSLAMREATGREVDLHRVEMTPDGGGDQVMLDGVSRYHYGPPVLGYVAGRPVHCCPVQEQIKMHLGYEPRKKDYGDMAVLTQHFGIALPPPYAADG